MGTIVISLDAELAWGFHDLSSSPFDGVDDVRDTWLKTLDLFDRFAIPATWAVVGHLFLESCDGRHGDHPLAPEWFDRDPGGSVESDEEWYAPDLIEAILDADVAHEIGCHSFSHVEFGNPATTRETVVAEIEECVKIAKSRDINLESFVYPRNLVGHRDVLAEHGFTTYRANKPRAWYHDTVLQGIMKAVSGTVGGVSPPIVTPFVDETDLVAIPASLYLFGFEGMARNIADSLRCDPIVGMVKRGVDRLPESDGVFHLCLHPHNLTTRYGLKRTNEILSYIDDHRHQTNIEVKTMSDVARSVRTGKLFGNRPKGGHEVSKF